jgi:hypothetical protein
MNRRDFVVTAGAALSLSRFGQERAVKIGYAAITWGGNDLAAIDDISSLGLHRHSAAIERTRAIR